MPFFSILLSLGMGLFPQAPVDPPRLRVEPPGRVDLGECGPREVKEREYRLHNTSQGPVSLRVLDLSPGVTVRGPALQSPILGGAEATLTLRLDPWGWQGFQTRNVRLITDDPKQGHYFLPVKVLIRPDLAVDGTRRDYGSVGAQESPLQSFLFTRETGEPFALRLTSDLPPYLEAETLPDGNRVRLAFTLRAGKVEPGVRLGVEHVRVETSAPLQPSFDLYLAWKLHHAVDAEPPRLVFLAPDPAVQDLQLASHDGAAFRIARAEVEGEGFQVEPAPFLEAPRQALRIRRTASATARAMLVLTFQGQDTELRVPLAYLPGASR